jgi:hypothetical protein
MLSFFNMSIRWQIPSNPTDFQTTLLKLDISKRMIELAVDETSTLSKRTNEHDFPNINDTYE